ncbi:hypothetical protein Gasu2_49700 [Galdieria sulphuraria]|nr:hypothetical protein Gasu2_49700 [Galdieria sulphuraria]
MLEIRLRGKNDHLKPLLLAILSLMTFFLELTIATYSQFDSEHSPALYNIPAFHLQGSLRGLDKFVWC